jgi:hypothetical protein
LCPLSFVVGVRELGQHIQIQAVGKDMDIGKEQSRTVLLKKDL